MPERRLRVLTWHVHGNYLYYLTQVPHDFYLVTDAERSTHHTGRSGRLPWGDNVHEAPVERIAQMEFDVVLFQSREAYDSEQYRILSPAQMCLPRIYLEHDPPQEHPTNTRHWVDDPQVLLVHVTHFNALMWDSGSTPTRVIEHGVLPLAEARWRGELETGLVVVNNLDRRGRRLGADVYEQVRRQVPLTLAGMGAERIAGGIGEVAQDALPALMASHRFFFHPIRYTSLGLSVIEAMMVGMPIVGLATTELPTVIVDGDSGFVDTRVDRLIDAMQRLLRDPAEARRVGDNARRVALERFNIRRFAADWSDALRSVAV
ncbi:glycosyltransferase family 4 protein [Piscinibacter sp. XHJ-5]|uniref:glycosyltransferase n=1 Tax=Piscinibacter sp. XHJ-5 TaxID=3037797 RepID=UPI0024531068|nr:glycosyltransferase family 4 protein [Piscinibacter sp. XHJ-5]